MILGDMFELGQESVEEHRAIVARLSSVNNCLCCFIGSYFYDCKIEKDTLLFFESYEIFANYFKNLNLDKNSMILIKGSRGMALERALDLF
jgi:UDP-N-acetylmuramoyl-tripeptide--D-alanyl-D-alanine ligase